MSKYLVTNFPKYFDKTSWYILFCQNVKSTTMHEETEGYHCYTVYLENWNNINHETIGTEFFDISLSIQKHSSKLTIPN